MIAPPVSRGPFQQTSRPLPLPLADVSPIMASPQQTQASIPIPRWPYRASASVPILGLCWVQGASGGPLAVLGWLLTPGEATATSVWVASFFPGSVSLCLSNRGRLSHWRADIHGLVVVDHGSSLSP